VPTTHGPTTSRGFRGAVPLRVGNLLLGGFLGAALATGILVVLGLGMTESPGLKFFVGCLIYPPIGYGIGTLCAADRMFRAG
jgi:hypothetical protein